MTVINCRVGTRFALPMVSLVAMLGAVGQPSLAQDGGSEPPPAAVPCPRDPSFESCVETDALFAGAAVVGSHDADGKADDRLVVKVGGDPLDRGLLVDVAGGALSGIDIYRSVQTGSYLRILGPNGRPVTQFGAGGQFETVAWVTISGVVREDGPNRTFVHPTDRPYMLGVWSDVIGPTAVFRSNMYAGLAGESWPISVISGKGRERLRIDDGGDILFGNISGNDVAGEKLQLRLGRVGDTGLLLRGNADGLDPARFLVEQDGWFGALDAAGDARRLIALQGERVTIGDGRADVAITGPSVRLDGTLTLGTIAALSVPAAAAGSLAWCADCETPALAISNGDAWQTLATGTDLAAQGRRLDEISGSVDAIGDRAEALESAVAAHGEQLASVVSEASRLDRVVTDVASRVDTLAVAVSEQNQALAATETRLDGRIEVLAGRADALGGAVEVLGEQIAGLTDETTRLGTAISDVAARVDGHDTRLGAVEEEVAEQRLALGAAGDRLNGLEATDLVHSAAIAGLQQLTGAAANKLGALAIGADTSAAQATGTASLALGSAARTTGNAALAIGAKATATAGGAVAVGSDSQAAGYQATAMGTFARALSDRSISVGRASAAAGDESVAVGNQASTSAAAAIALGSRAVAGGVAATAVGRDTKAGGVSATALGADASAAGTSALALGNAAQAVAENSVALGTAASASGARASALGRAASASGRDSLAVGSGALASGERSLATGTNAKAIGDGASATGADSSASGHQAIASGVFARAAGDYSMALGRATFAAGSQSTAVGALASAAGDNTTAVGGQANAGAAGATAIGAQAAAAHANSTAIGAGAKTTATNQLALGSSQTAVVVAGIDASTEAQQGPVDVVTVDANGTLGRQRVATAQSVQRVHEAVDYISAVTDAQFGALAGNVQALGGRVDALEQGLVQLDRKISSSTAAAVAMGGGVFLPNQKFNLTANVATYDGAHAGSLQIGALVDEHIAFNAGVATGFNREGKTAGRVGFTVGF